MQAWKFNTAEGRWAGFGPYYAMFPMHFARDVVETMCPKGGKILDPFCGRGTAPYAAQVTDRSAVGVDINPVAWVFAKTKTEPTKEPLILKERLSEVGSAIKKTDKRAENEFQQWAWCSDVLGFLNAARRTLNWEQNRVDRTLMGFVLMYLHSKLNEGLSNQMLKARALGPDYSVNWWRNRKMRPPSVNPIDFLRKRIEWRYAHGVIPNRSSAKILLGAAEEELSSIKANQFDLLLTSPPYLGITKYRHDSWIRLWMLKKGPALPDWKPDPGSSKATYQQMINAVFATTAKLLKPRGVVWVRTDARATTKKATEEAIQAQWPTRKLYVRHSDPLQYRTQTAHSGNNSLKPGEVDFLIPGSYKVPFGFVRA